MHPTLVDPATSGVALGMRKQSPAARRVQALKDKRERKKEISKAVVSARTRSGGDVRRTCEGT